MWGTLRESAFLTVAFVVSILCLFSCRVQTKLWTLKAAMTSFDHLVLSSHQSQTDHSHQASLVSLWACWVNLGVMANRARWYTSGIKWRDNLHRMSVKTKLKQEGEIVSSLTSSIPITVSGRQPRVVKLALGPTLTGSTFLRTESIASA